jgi:hypothetical protein
MNRSELSPLSRREWLERMSLPAAAAALGAGILASRATGAEPSLAASAANEANLLGARIYNVRNFGAKGDGTSLDTAAVQAAIDACNGDHGGTVLVPAGDFVVGTLELKSNVTLHLAAQGRLLGSPDPKDYHAGKGIPPGNGNIVLLGAANIENVTIEGQGTIDGNGLKFWNGQGDNTGPGQGGVGGYFNRPHLIVFSRCKNVRMRDVFLVASAYHCTRILNCERVWLDGVRIYNRVNKNNDGFHINSCQYVHIANCDVKCQDDACALFGSNKWVTITGCTFSTRWSIFRFGGGEAENITISNCVIYDTFGSAIKMSGSGRSRFENILFSNLIMNNVTGPITIGLQRGGRRRPVAAAATPNPSVASASAPAGTVAPNGGTPATASGTVAAASGGAAAPPPPANLGVVRNIAFNGIRAYVAADGQQFPDMHWEQGYREGEQHTCITLNGVGDAFLENISFNDVHVIYEGGGTAKEAAIRNVPQVAGEYFEIGPRPAYGLYARNVHGLTLNNVRFEVKNPDVRPAMIFDHVVDAAVTGLSAQGNSEAESLLRFVDSKDVLITAARVLTPVPVFLRVEGEANENITVDGGDISKATKPLDLASGGKSDAVKLRV